MDHQPNHVSLESKQTVVPKCLENDIFNRFYIKGSSLHSQAVDQNAGASLQTKVKKDFRAHSMKLNNKLMRGIPVEKLGLQDLRKLIAVFVQTAFMNLIRNEKELQLKAFNNAGLNYYPMRVYGGYDGMKCKQSIFNACNVNYSPQFDNETFLDPRIDPPISSINESNKSNEHKSNINQREADEYPTESEEDIDIEHNKNKNMNHRTKQQYVGVEVADKLVKLNKRKSVKRKKMYDYFKRI